MSQHTLTVNGGPTVVYTLTGGRQGPPGPDLVEDRAAIEAAAAAAAADAIATAADRVQTGLDAVATAADRVQTGADVVTAGAYRDDAITQATTATAQAMAAATSRAAIDNRIYPTASASNPTVRPDGSAVQSGDMYFNSTSQLWRRYNGSTWVASDINTADLAASSGAELVGYTPRSDTRPQTTVAEAIDAINPAVRQAQQLMQRLHFGESCNMIVLGDSTGDATTEWIYLLATKIGTDFPAFTVRYKLWDTGTNDYGSATTIQTGSGSPPVFTVYNASVSGSTSNRFMGTDFAAAVRPSAMGQDPDLMVLSYGHNGGRGIEAQFPMQAAAAGEISRLLPFTPVLMVCQNPVTSDSTMAEKVRVFKALAAASGYGVVDVHEYFREHLSPLASYYADTVHPNSAGSAAWRDAVYQAFRLCPNSASGNAVSHLNRGVLYSVDSYVALTEWSKSPSLSMARETSTFETNGECTKITGASQAGGDFISKQLITSADIVSYRGRYVTLTVRMAVPAGSNSAAGRIALYDGTSTYLSANGGPQGIGFYTQAVTMKVGAAATVLTAYIYLSTSGGTTDFIYIDRITLSDGPLPRDVQPPNELDDVDFLRVLGSRSGGVMVVRNLATSATALQVLDTNAGADSDDPATQYVMSLSADGLKAKLRSSSYTHLEIAPNGTLKIGAGAAAPDMQIAAQGTGLLRFAAAHLYSNLDAGYDLGLNNYRWRAVYAISFRHTATVGHYHGTGTPEGSVTAGIGSTYARLDGGAGSSFYVKESGTGPTGWVAK